jgi:hypothetical protein
MLNWNVPGLWWPELVVGAPWELGRARFLVFAVGVLGLLVLELHAATTAAARLSGIAPKNSITTLYVRRGRSLRRRRCTGGSAESGVAACSCMV